MSRFRTYRRLAIDDINWPVLSTPDSGRCSRAERVPRSSARSNLDLPFGLITLVANLVHGDAGVAGDEMRPTESYWINVPPRHIVLERSTHRVQHRNAEPFHPMYKRVVHAKRRCSPFLGWLSPNSP